MTSPTSPQPGSGTDSGTVGGTDRRTDSAPASWPRAYAVTAAAFVVVDGLWISLAAAPLYRAEMPALVRESPQWVPAVAFYLLFVAALVHFAVRPGSARGSARHAAVQGGALGLTAYATYALTSLSVIEGFATAAAVADLVWGGVLGAAVATIAVLVLTRTRLGGGGTS